MAEILNLSRARKQKTRNEKQVQADLNRRHFGRSKTEKQKDDARAGKNQLEQQSIVHQLDQAKLSPAKDGPDDDKNR